MLFRFITDEEYENGQAIAKKRRNYAKKRQSLQSKNTKSAKRRLKELSGRENRWMTEDIAYKAREHGSYLIKVNPAYTSQHCPKCGTICKENRDKTNHIYHCNNCHYQSNDDRVAAMNIVQLGQMKQQGIKKPSFKTYD